MATITIDQILAASPVTVRGQPTKLSADSKGERIVYASGKSIFVRQIDDPSTSKEYIGHTAATTVARFSPSGFYIASGDVSGKVRVWDAVGAVNTKGDYGIISGRINDIGWDGDSQRIIAVGDGRERFGHCITADSGNSVGEVSGHSKIVNAVALRQQRPLRAATVSDDGSMCFLHGAPFKFNSKADGLHKGFIFDTAFSPDGSRLVTVGADRRIQLYDGKTGEPTTALSSGSDADAHTGSIFAVSWAADSKRLVTASADQTVRTWDVESGKALDVWKISTSDAASVASIADQQVGVVWPHGRSDHLIISISLCGDLNYLVPGKAEPVRVVQGHNKAITALGTTSDGKGSDIWTGSFDGRICHWDLAPAAGGVASVADGQTHLNQVTQFAAAAGRTYSVGWDDTLRLLDEGARAFVSAHSSEGAIKLGAQPKGVATAGNHVFVALASGKIAVYGKDGDLVGEFTTADFTPTAIAAYGSFVAVGSSAEPQVLVYKYTGKADFSLVQRLSSSTSPITTLAFSGGDGGKHLAAGNSNGKIVVYDTATWAVATDRWSAHTARVTSIAWNDAGTHAVSGGLDTNVFVWSLAKPGSRVKAVGAHKDGVSGVAWVEGSTKVASAGTDAAVKIWKVAGLQ